MSICSYWCQSIFGDGAACSCGAAPSTPETTKILDPAALVEKLNRGQMWSEDLKSAFGYLAQKCGELQDEIARLRGPSTPGAADPATRIIAAWGEYKSAAAEAERTTSYSDGFAAGDAWGRFEDLMDSLARPSRPAEAKAEVEHPHSIALRNIRKKCFDGSEWARYIDAVLGEKPASEAEPTYPCEECGTRRTKAEGGTTFTICDACWDKSDELALEQVPTLPPQSNVGTPTSHLTDLLTGSPKAMTTLYASEAKRRGWDMPAKPATAEPQGAQEWWLVKWPSGLMEVRMGKPTSGHAAFSTEVIRVREVVEAPGPEERGEG